MNPEVSAGGSKPAAAKHVLHGVWRHVLIDLFLAEILLAVFFVVRLPIPVRPVRLDAADLTSLTVRESTGTWPAQSLTLTEREEIAAHCAAFRALRAPRERHPSAQPRTPTRIQRQMQARKTRPWRTAQPRPPCRPSSRHGGAQAARAGTAARGCPP